VKNSEFQMLTAAHKHTA